MPDKITLGGLTFNDPATVDADGTLWLVTELDGWEAADVDLAVIDRYDDGGVYGASPRLKPRAIQLAGVGKPASAVSAWVAAERLNRAMALVRVNGTLKVFADVTRRATVRRSGRVRTRIKPALVEFQVPLIAADPRRYGDTLESQTITIASGAGANTGVIANDGTARSAPTVTITSGSGAATVVVQNQTTGETVELDRAKALAEEIVFDFDAKTVKVDGVSVYADLEPSSRWWQLEPGNNTIAVSRGSSPANSMGFVFSWRDAWE